MLISARGPPRLDNKSWLTCVQDLDPHLMSPRRGNLDVLNFQRFTGSPAHCSLAGDNFSDSVGFSHSDDDKIRWVLGRRQFSRDGDAVISITWEEYGYSRYGLGEPDP